MGESRLDQLSALGQSIWYDNISRDQLKSGELQRLIDEDAVVGVTSNPTIFEKAIDGSNYYDAAIKQLVASGQTDEKVIFTALTVEDIQMACDLLRPTYDRTKGEDGYVSIEVTPDAANDTKSTIFQTRALWKAVGRPNVMVKIPATAEGLPAIEQMTYEGVNINITLIFSLDIYEKVARAYIRGLGFRREEKLPLDQIHSVASFFVSRVDTLVDKQLDAKIAATTDSAEQEKLRGLHGKAAIANARLAYQKYLQIFKGAEFAPLAAAGATVQRCLWASTSTKNPSYRDVMYVEELIGPETVDTMPPATIKAFQDHGVVASTIEQDIPGVHETMTQLAAAGIDMDAVTKQLEIDGVKIFTDSYDTLLASVKHKVERIQTGQTDPHVSAVTAEAAAPAEPSPAPQPDAAVVEAPVATVGTGLAAEVASVVGSAHAATTPQLGEENPPPMPPPVEAAAPTPTPPAAPALPTNVASLGSLEAAVQAACAQADSDRLVERTWQKDPTVWKPEGSDQREITDRLGWLTVMNEMAEDIGRLQALRDQVRAEGIRWCVLLGMGGSSLAPEVMRETFHSASGQPELIVLDTTDPATISGIQQGIDLSKTLFLVASKSGGTIETISQYQYFRAQLERLAGDQAGQHFIAITDAGTKLDQLAQDARFRDIFRNPSDIGGRYSALSFFGLVPAAIIGVDVAKLLDRARAMARVCSPGPTTDQNPGAWLGTVLGTAARAGRDKVTFVISPPVATFGSWVEQLIAESTGKEGKGIVPVVGEDAGAPIVYGTDRIFAYLRTQTGFDARQDDAMAALEAAGQPVVRITLQDVYDLGGEFFRWEMATAVAGSLLGINAFDQPNVQESKDATDRLLKDYTANGKLPSPQAILQTESRNVVLYADGPQGEKVRGADSLQAALERYLSQVQQGDYIALLAYLRDTSETAANLQRVRMRLRDMTRKATTTGFGPRFQHSTGQLHKGGANNGVFIQFTTPDSVDLPIPGAAYSFSVLKQAQALGDLQTLEARGRRVIRIVLRNVDAGLTELLQALGATRV